MVSVQREEGVEALEHVEEGLGDVGCRDSARGVAPVQLGQSGQLSSVVHAGTGEVGGNRECSATLKFAGLAIQLS